jgi:hypothetical protein
MKQVIAVVEKGNELVEKISSIELCILKLIITFCRGGIQIWWDIFKKLSIFSDFSSDFSAAVDAQKWLYGCAKFRLLPLQFITTFYTILYSPSPQHPRSASKQFALNRMLLIEIGLNELIALK